MVDWLDDLNEEQKEAVFFTDGPLLILAGAGSGKTRVIAYRIAYLIQRRGIPPQNIFAVTFTNKAAGEMKQRVEALLEQPVRGMWIGTFHSACARILRVECQKFGFKPNFLIMDEDDQEHLLKEGEKELNLKGALGKPAALRERISNLKTQLVYPDEYLSTMAHSDPDRSFGLLYKKYQELLKMNNAFDFDDLLYYSVVLFKTDPLALERYQKTFLHVLVDEFQDINFPQYELVKMIASRSRNICAVGDDYQAIYSWRGANVRYMLESFERDFTEAKIVRMERNYRSGQTILDAANEVISRIARGKEKRLWSSKPDEHPPLVRYQAQDQIEEARFVAREIERLFKDEDRAWKDFAILYRTNSQSRVFEEIFMARRIPFQVIGGLRFYERKEVKDVISLLSFLVNPLAEAHLMRVLSWVGGIGSATLEKATESGLPLWEGLLQLKESSTLKAHAREALDKLLELLLVFREKRQQLGLTELFKEIVQSSGYLEYWQQQGTLEAQNRLENVKELLNLSRQLEDDNPELTVEEFLSHLSLYTDLDAMKAEKDAVILMTVHSAKGLEFPYVFITGLEEGVFPHWRSSSPDEFDEERRLCYVAITRAQSRVYFTWARNRFSFGNRVSSEVSRFLKEIPEEFFGESASAFGEELKKGKRIWHQAWGEGVIKGVDGEGENAIIEVYFPTVGRKKLILKYAPITIMD